MFIRARWIELVTEENGKYKKRSLGGGGEHILYFSKRHRVPKKTNMTHNFKFFSHYK